MKPRRVPTLTHRLHLKPSEFLDGLLSLAQLPMAYSSQSHRYLALAFGTMHARSKQFFHSPFMTIFCGRDGVLFESYALTPLH